MAKRSLAELQKMRKTLKQQCPLPPEVTLTKRLLPDARWAYIFHHNQWGELGRIVIVPIDGNNTQFSVEVCGDADDPMTKKRLEILQPLSTQLLETMRQLFGKGTGEIQSYQSPKEAKTVDAQHIFCDKCKALVALTFFAEDADTAGDLENYARLSFSKTKEINVPTWIIGAEREVYVDGQFVGEALVLKVWPTRESARMIHSHVLESLFAQLIAEHC